MASDQLRQLMLLPADFAAKGLLILMTSSSEATGLAHSNANSLSAMPPEIVSIFVIPKTAEPLLPYCFDNQLYLDCITFV